MKLKMQQENKVYLSLLYDFYKDFLTERQKKIIELYVNEDLTLGEISKELGISRQGVFDAFRKAKIALKRYEAKLKLADKYYKNRSIIEEVLQKLRRIYERYKDEEIMSIINSIQEWQEDV
ncbi:YlxM family DNA-binding protein [Caldicellulosiruptor bescii]|nr:sigma factor-like helix-turn-helix DNA-binding protein [Caldicellulosiruptor bescii]